MLIKLNGVPWDNVKVPDMTGFKFVEPSAFGNCESITDVAMTLVDHFDKETYFLMNKTDITEHFYKASCWAVDKAIHFGGGWY
jgi:hypothetical protein